MHLVVTGPSAMSAESCRLDAASEILSTRFAEKQDNKMDRKRLSSTGVLLVATLLLMPALVAFSERDPLDDVAPGVVHVDQETAFAHDVSLMAEQTGLSVDEAERAMRQTSPHDD